MRLGLVIVVGAALAAGGCGPSRYAYDRDIFQREANREVRGDEFLRQIRQAEIDAAKKREDEAKKAEKAASQKSSKEPSIPVGRNFVSG